MKIHYLSIYNIPKFFWQNRRFSPAGQKMEYIIDVLNEIGYDVNFISFAESRNKKIYFPCSAKMNSKTRFFLAPYVPFKKITERVMYAWLFLYSFFHIKKGDTILVYHTNGMRNDLIKKIANKRKAQFIYEIEGIYTLANETVDPYWLDYELKSLECPDKYLFCTKLLEEKINKYNKPFAIVEGNYKSFSGLSEKYNDSKIHLLYAGIIDSVKGGAFNAVKVAEYLDENYVLHILGFGDIDALKEQITEISKRTKCKIIYEGTKTGREYIETISKYHIGLSLQNIGGLFNDTSFPSKVLVYLSCGLSVVSGKIKCLSQSKLSSAISFYDFDEPEHIAEIIKNTDINKINNTNKLLNELHEEFKKDLKILLEE